MPGRCSPQLSSEMSCDICHSGGPASELRVTMENILQLHNQKVGTRLHGYGGQGLLGAPMSVSLYGD